MLRRALAEQYNLGSADPNIQVWNVDLRGDRSLTMRHFSHQRRPLGPESERVLEHLAYLWGFTVRLETQLPDGNLRQVGEYRSEKRSRQIT
jgi:spore cortex formation protein SpoVR/YcgB (stage V sporulation)